MTKRKSLVICLVVAFALSLLMAITCMMPQRAALADGEDFAVKGASLRYTTTEKENGENDDGTGLRFVLNAKQTYIDAAEEIGLLLIPADMLEEGEELTVETEDAIKNPKGDSDWTVDGDYMSTYFYLWNIPETDCDREVVARGYAKVDGNYVYTTEQERSFESVAIAAMAGSTNTQEDKDMCAALSKYVVTDPGNVAYFGTDNVVNVSATGNNGASNFGTVDFGGEKVHRIGWTSPAGLRIQATPVIKDFSAYNYFYMDFYIAGEGNYTMNPGVIWANDISIPANQWTRIVFAKDANGVFKTADGKTLIREGFNSTYVGLVDISFGVDIATSIDVYIREMRLTNAVPSLDIKLGDVVEGDTVTIADTYEVVNAENATVNVKVSVDGAAATAITESTYTFANKGTYTFIYDFIVDGKTVTYSKTVKATVKLYVVADLTDPDAVNKYSITSNWGAPLVANYPTASPTGGTGSLQIDNSGGGGASHGIIIGNPAINDVSSYKYFFMDVRTGWRDMPFGCYGTEKPMYTIPTATWTRVVLVNNGSGTFTMPKGSYGTSAFGNASTNIKGELFYTNNVAWDYFYFGLFAACNELPELPEGMVTNLTPEEAEAKKVYTIVNFTDPDCVSTYGITSKWSGLLNYWPTGHLQLQGQCFEPSIARSGIGITNPAITDVSGYKYLFLDVKADYISPNVWFENGGTNVKYQINNGEWTRIILVSDGNGNFTIPGSDNETAKVFANAKDISNLEFFVHEISNQYVYFGMFGATNSLPEVPAGYATNYTGEAE